MGRLGKFTLYVVVTLLLVSVVAGIVQYQIRLRLLIGEPLVVGFSKGAWTECLSQNELAGRIDRVGLNGITVTDKSGTFSSTNMRASVANGDRLCPTLEIVVLDSNQRQYFVPFRYIGGVKKNENWFWSNPFPT
ncbi:MAG: hypothetical protein Q7R66_15035 [Undibacterium sp.]|uniref:hypothetical protein n=1 Tax=Undibacterium sp. TaxID=1914977 RepID=UPI00271A6508|nr:hypothetical protein [Undibacterium sp.]MDO8653496.1 hypothetical protein [Undibacterium sp.]